MSVCLSARPRDLPSLFFGREASLPEFQAYQLGLQSRVRAQIRKICSWVSHIVENPAVEIFEEWWWYFARRRVIISKEIQAMSNCPSCFEPRTQAFFGICRRAPLSHAAQQCVHLTSGSLRVLQAFFGL
jgi:hypothetical protein